MLLPLVISAIEDDDQRSFMEQVYIDHQLAMYRTALRITGNRTDTEDIVQTACLKLCNKIPLLMGLECCNLEPYIVITVRNTAIDFLRQRRRRDELLWAEEDYADSLLEIDPAVEDRLLIEAGEGKLSLAIRKLSEKDRNLLERKYILLQEDTEIALALGVRINTLISSLSRVRKRLAKLLEGNPNEAD